MNTTSMRLRFLLQGFLLVFTVLLGSIGLRAQGSQMSVGKFVYVTPKAGTLPQKAECVDEAGVITTLINIRAKSSSFAGVAAGGTLAYASRPEIIYLCRGDQFTIDYNETSGNITGDPNPDTEPGVAFGIYSCDPSITGPTIQDIITDDCRLRGGSAPFDQTNELVYIRSDDDEYDRKIFDVTLFNSDTRGGQDIPALFPDPSSGRPLPTLITLAATTIDGLVAPKGTPAGSQRLPVFEGSDTTNDNTLIPGCTDVNVDQLTRIVYLNEITAVVGIDDSGCSGTVVVRGGITEFREEPNYVITLTNVDLGTSTILDNETTYLSGDTVSFSSTVPGNYEISVVDNISCDFPPTSFSLSVCLSTAPLSITAIPTNVSCSGVTDGRITVTANGGVAPYTVTLQRTTPASPPVTPPNTITADGENTVFNNLSGGVYRVIVTDAAGDIQRRENIDIAQPGFTVAIQVVEAFDCFDDNEGTLTAVIFDGTNQIPADSIANYDFTWTDGTSTFNTRTIADIPPGNYSVTAVNRNTGCTTTDSENFRAPNRLLIVNSTLNTDAATCSGVSDGSVRISVSGGTQDSNGNYTVTWSDGQVTTNTDVRRNDLLPGNYSVVVTDANECSATSDFTIAAEKTILLAADSANITCFGDADGSISVTASTEGAPADLPYVVSLLDSTGSVVRTERNLVGNGSTPLDFDNLDPGTYTVVLRDSDSEGCEVQQTITIVEPAVLDIGTPVTTDQACPDIAGTVTINATGGTGPYTYQFRNDSIPDPMNPMDTLRTFDSTTVDNLNTLGELTADTNYVVIVTDANGCIDSTTFKIFSPPQASVQPIAIDSVTCPGDSNGQLFVDALPPPGDSITITGYAWYRVNADGSRGAVLDGVVGQRTEADLSVGFYEVEISLSNECTSSYLGQVAGPGLVALDSTTISPPACLGESTGSISVFPSGGTPNDDGTYNYRWSTAPGSTTTSNSIDGLASGTYSVTITDANNCQPAFATNFTIEDPVGIAGNFTIDNVSCPSDTITDGIATFEARFSNDSTGLFDFFWSSGDTIRQQPSATVRNLPRGLISVTITDGTCLRTFTDSIGSPEDFAFTPDLTGASCNGIEDGTVTVDVTGGTPSYTFDWVDRTEMSNTLDSVAAGNYQLVVTDANGCVADTFTVVVTQPDPLLLIIDENVTTPLVTCADDEDGVIGVLVISTNNNELGDNPYTWSPSVADDDESVARDLAAGTYSVTVTDTRGCQDTLSYTIINPQPIQFFLEEPASPLCFGETTTIQLDTVFGGQASSFGSYTFSIGEDGFLIPADQAGTTFAGQQIITVFDSVGCSASDTFDIDQPEEIVIDLEDRIRIELGDRLTQLDPLITPSSGSYTYKWTPADSLSSDSIRAPFVFPIRDKEYTLTVTNQNGCTAIDDVLVTIDANRNVFIPNSFSPNQDGINEEFRLFGCLGVQSIDRVGIYNRWGGLIAEEEGMLPSCLDGTVLWNGANPKRKLVDPGVYVYVIQVTFIDGNQLTYRGDITVIR